jgi:hypothetical protein
VQALGPIATIPLVDLIHSSTLFPLIHVVATLIVATRVVATFIVVAPFPNSRCYSSVVPTLIVTTSLANLIYSTILVHTFLPHHRTKIPIYTTEAATLVVATPIATTFSSATSVVATPVATTFSVATPLPQLHLQISLYVRRRHCTSSGHNK